MATKAKKTTKKETVQMNFANGVFIREVEFKDGNTILNINFNARSFCEWMKDNVDTNGYVRTTVSKNTKEDSKYTHYMRLNEYNPQEEARKTLDEATKDMPF